MKILITVDKFGVESRKMLREYSKGKYEIKHNEIGRKLTQKEVKELIIKENPDVIIAGTEKYSSEVLDYCPKLKMISRVGSGLDSVDLDGCEKRGIIVANTPDAPSNAVAELTIGQIFNSLRKIQNTDRNLREGEWKRYIGRDLSECYVGIVGYGRIGKIVARKLKPLAGKIYINDIDPVQIENAEERLIVSSLERILRDCDIVTLHIHLDKQNKNFISKKELGIMKKDAILINTSRGGVVNEDDLYEWLSENQKASAAVDVFVEEPYNGKFRQLQNCYITPHLGSCTIKSRDEMEIGAVKNIEKAFSGEI